MLTKQTPDSIKARLKFKGQGLEQDLQLTYHNRLPTELQAWLANQDNMQVPDSVDTTKQIDLGIAHINAGVVMYMVKSFDDGTDEAFPLTRAGLIDLEAHWPGILMGIIQGYHKARGVELEKN